MKNKDEKCNSYTFEQLNFFENDNCQEIASDHYEKLKKDKDDDDKKKKAIEEATKN